MVGLFWSTKKSQFPGPTMIRVQTASSRNTRNAHNAHRTLPAGRDRPGGRHDVLQGAEGV
ncbi:uncharacterized protein N7498_006876 [Penicillium cinerascens]|uniref:Uncharacterized protein n=1 Tax=Penicillium cinerascens TaxID=70096 RepID=A0A9W9JIT6_9EURO|nr:uncharacterized protein N7498_006876 [Penicillium cinerascens]KAJ5197759.1 hypothetical protein N7498_006876 [Penicillium cinerascens]